MNQIKERHADKLFTGIAGYTWPLVTDEDLYAFFAINIL
jgi:hypothetical protein